jgi:predicted ThiF/HesA family dinucleotide-utilizing enzyme
MFNHNPRIVCQNGFSISVQAHAGSYCKHNESGELTHVECGFPSTTPKTKELLEYAECFGNHGYTETVYGYVPVEVVQAELEAHGGIISGKMP